METTGKVKMDNPVAQLIEDARIASRLLRKLGYSNIADYIEEDAAAVGTHVLPITLVGCSRCQRGYPVRYMAGGMCATCLYKELKAGRL